MDYGVTGDESLADHPEGSGSADAIRARVGEPALRPYNPACAAEDMEGIDMGAIIFGATTGQRAFVAASPRCQQMAGEVGQEAW